MGKIILITGGARSGKSDFALKLASGIGGRVVFVATAEPLDDEMKIRIARHRETRPRDWVTLEVPMNITKKLTGSIRETDTVIIDCLTMLVNNLIYYCTLDDRQDVSGIERLVEEEVNSLVDLCTSFPANFIIITNEVGSGIVPGDNLSRTYRDLLGKTNQNFARHAHEVYLMVSGIPLRIK